MQGRDSCRLDPATSIQEQKYAVYSTYFAAIEKRFFFVTVTNSTFQFRRLKRWLA